MDYVGLPRFIRSLSLVRKGWKVWLANGGGPLQLLQLLLLLHSE